MKAFNIIAIFIYTLIFSIIGAILIALSLRTESFDWIINMLGYFAHANNVRFGMALTGFFLILINISIAQLSIGKLRKRKTIAFENPHGQVTLSLTAIEDYIKKLTHKMSEVKEIKSSVFAGKSGIEVITRAVLYSDVNIPEVTEKMQNTIRLRLEEMLGIEEPVSIKVHVTKILHREKDVEQRDTVEEAGHGGFKGEIEYGK